MQLSAQGFGSSPGAWPPWEDQALSGLGLINTIATGITYLNISISYNSNSILEFLAVWLQLAYDRES